MSDLPSEAVVIEYAPNQLVFGWGPFRSYPNRPEGRLAFYVNDFFLTDPAPWKCPARYEDVSRADIQAWVPPGAIEAPTVDWDGLSREAYRRAFDAVMERIAAASLAKAVPVVVDRGRSGVSAETLVPWLLTRALQSPSPGFLYGSWNGSGGVLGVTPELLFDSPDGRTVETHAVAGTGRPGEVDKLRSDDKELAEHRSVVDDIAAALCDLGPLEIEPLGVLQLRDMIHLHTDIRVVTTGGVTLEMLVRRLHPTAALGVAPRGAGLDILRELADTVDRGWFGAPFGVEWPDGRTLCLVAIRNVRWQGPDLAVAAGAGLVAQSRFEAEWNEVVLKCGAVKRTFGL